MRYRIRLCLLLLNLATSALMDAISPEDRRNIRRMLDYIVYEDYDDYEIEDCDDPCTLKKQLIDPKYVEATRKEIIQCSATPVSCTSKEKNSKYPSMDGSCNNLRFPDWGMSETCHRRILPPDYADGKSYPRKSCLGVELPNARVVSNVLNKVTPRNRTVFDRRLTLYHLAWGEAITHDISLSESKGLPERGRGSCCDPYPRVDDDCIAVAVPPDDTFYPGKRNCLSFTRTLACPSCKQVRHTLNNATAYIDLSIVYGNNKSHSRTLRSGRNGMLLTQEIPGVGSLPPGVTKNGRCAALNNTHLCFLAGDDRINQNPLIATLHIVLLRNHNNLCRRLKQLNPHWNDERLYQEARKINIAQGQFITFGDYLKNGWGIKIPSDFKMDVSPGTSYTIYDPAFDPSVTVETSTTALRHGHSAIPNTLLEHNPATEELDVIFLRDYYWWPFEFYNGQMDRLALGLAEKPPNKRSLLLGTDVRDFLYHRRQEKLFEGTDLAALSIIRGREHGIPGYTYYLKYFFDYEVRSFCDLRKFIPIDSILKMKQVYESVHDIDLYTGGSAERKTEGSFVGPTFGSILSLHFKAQKFGNRYYFEHKGQAGSLMPGQLSEIKKTSLSQILCETTKIRKIQKDAFAAVSDSNRIKPCKHFPKLNLDPWKEQKKVGGRRSSRKQCCAHDIFNVAHVRRLKNDEYHRCVF